MSINSELYRDFPADIRLAYARAVRARGASERHDLLLELTKTALEYLASLALSDYRSRDPSPSEAVEVLVESTRSRSLTLANILELFHESAAAVPDSLFPTSSPLGDDDLLAAGRLSAAVRSIKAALNQSPPEVGPLALAADEGVAEALSTPPIAVSWWTAWKTLVEYCEHVLTAPSSPRPARGSRFFAVFNPLLENAIIELLTYPPAAELILGHPLASLTLVVPNRDGTVTHTLCGEDRGVWFDTEIVRSSPITDVWSADQWRATAASKYILDRSDGDGYVIRALYWDLHESPPPPATVPLQGADTRGSRRSRAARRMIQVQEGRGEAPGTCGEFAQGPLPDGEQFHVTCPINKSSTVLVELVKADELAVTGLQSSQHKLEQALRFTCEHLDLGSVTIRARHWTDLDIGKGMGVKYSRRTRRDSRRCRCRG